MIDIIIPTYDNVDQLVQCVYSLGKEPNIIIVNNGFHPLENFIRQDNVKILTPGVNLGWEGGLKHGLEHCNNDIVIFSNDDIFIPYSSAHWQESIYDWHAVNEKGALGFTSNCVSGKQNIWYRNDETIIQTTYLVGFFMVLNRKSLDAVGGVDDTLCGGDDIDLSIRLRKAGYPLYIDTSIFIYHHGFQTGTKLNGDHTKEGGWNSNKMIEETNMALIKKHGFNWWFNTMSGVL